MTAFHSQGEFTLCRHVRSWQSWGRNALEEDSNPLKRVLVVVSSHDSEVMMDILEGEARSVGDVHRSLAL